ncbi:MAG: hypothetical protein COB04_12640 [Gammaproteobacteria bacterium]|nr:MAG: hypothetical protein COB04_12640 [Gammaproteobacteria bacterium]
MNKIVSLFRSKCSSGQFEQLMSSHIDGLFRQAYHYTGSHADAEDLLQDLLASLYPRINELKSIEKLQPWLLRCLYNRFVDNYRKKQRLPETENIDDPAIFNDIPARTPAETVRVQVEINRALHTLTPSQRAVVCLHDIEGYSLPELVDTLEQPLGTLKSHLHRARSQLKKQLELQPFTELERL